MDIRERRETQREKRGEMTQVIEERGERRERITFHPLTWRATAAWPCDPADRTRTGGEELDPVGGQRDLRSRRTSGGARQKYWLYDE